jgi:hypothetical protein
MLETKRTKVRSIMFGERRSAVGTAGFGRTNERFIAKAAVRRRGIRGTEVDIVWFGTRDATCSSAFIRPMKQWVTGDEDDRCSNAELQRSVAGRFNSFFFPACCLREIIGDGRQL